MRGQLVGNAIQQSGLSEDQRQRLLGQLSRNEDGKLDEIDNALEVFRKQTKDYTLKVQTALS